jgi:hypothetical protein
MNNFFIYQPVSLSTDSTPIVPIFPVTPLPSFPSLPSSSPPPLIVLPQSSQLTF